MIVTWYTGPDVLLEQPVEEPDITVGAPDAPVPLPQLAIVEAAKQILAQSPVGAMEQTAGSYGCPGGQFQTDYTCLYEHENFNRNRSGRMLKFREPGRWQNLAIYDFDNKASSWVNTRGSDSLVALASDGNGTQGCLDSQAVSTRLGGNFSESVSSIRIYDVDNLC